MKNTYLQPVTKKCLLTDSQARISDETDTYKPSTS